MDYSEVKRALVFAFKIEATSFIERLKYTKKAKLENYTIYLGDYLGVHTIVLVTGCGFEVARQSVQALVQSCIGLQHIYNIGFVGSISDFYDIGEVVQVGQVFRESGQLLSTKLALHNSFPIVKCISVRSAVEDEKRKENIKDKFDVDIVDMEAEGVCESLSTFAGKVSIFKIISDSADADFKQNIINNSKLLSAKLERELKVVLDDKP